MTRRRYPWSAAGLMLAAIGATASTARPVAALPPAEKPDDPPPHEERPPFVARPKLRLAPVGPPPQSDSVDSHLVLQAVTAGVLPIVGLWMASSSQSRSAALVIVAATPLAVGGVVCGFGAARRDRRGSCPAAIAGASLGALATVPLLLLGAQLDRGEGDVHLGGVLLGAIGWFVLQPTLAIAGWQAFSEARTPAPVPATAPSPREPRRALPAERPRGRAFVAGELVVPVLSLSF